MAKATSDSAAAPAMQPQVSPGLHADVSSFTLTAAYELAAASGRIESDVKNLVKSVDALTAELAKTNDRVGNLEGKSLLIVGGVIVALILIPSCAAVVWWALGNQITALLIRPPSV